MKMSDFVFSPRVIRGCRLCRKLLPLFRRQGCLVSSLWHSARRCASDCFKTLRKVVQLTDRNNAVS